MLNDQTDRSRDRILARSRVYLAGIIAGGLAAAAGFAVAAANADSAPTATKQSGARPPSHPRHGAAHRVGAGSAYVVGPSPSASPTRSPVRAVTTRPHRTHAAAPVPKPAASTHAS